MNGPLLIWDEKQWDLGECETKVVFGPNWPSVSIKTKRWKHHNCCYQKIRQVQCRSRTLSTTKQGSTLVKCWVFEARITMVNFHDFYSNTMRLILCYRSFKMNQFYKNFPFGVIQKLHGPIFDLFWPPTHLSWTFVDIWSTTFPLSKWTYKNLTTSPLCTVCTI